MADVIRDVLIRGRIELVEGKLKAPDLSPFEEELAAANKQAKELTASIKAAGEASHEAADMRRRVSEEERREYERSLVSQAELARQQRQTHEDFLRGAEGARTFADGAFTAARGLALIGLEGDQNLESVVRKIAEVQGQFDVFRGSIDAVKGGVETARAFGDAMQRSAGPLGLVGTRLGAVAAFLGPAGTLAVAAGGTALAVGLLWRAFADDADDAISRTEKRLEDLRESNDRLRERERIAAESARRRGLIESDAEQFRRHSEAAGAIRQPIAVDSLRGRADNFRRRGAAEDALGRFEARARRDRRAIRPGTPEAREQERLYEAFRAAGGSVSDIDRQLLAEQYQNAIDVEKRRFDAIEGQRGAFESLSGRENEQRESDIRQAESARSRREQEVERTRDQLAAARRVAQEQENTRLRELDRIGNPAQRRFAEQALAGLPGFAADGLDRRERQVIERLEELLPQSSAQAIQDARTIAAGGTPVARPDRVADLEGKLERVLDKLDAATGGVSRLRAEDAQLDAEAEETAERIIGAFKRASDRIEVLELELDALAEHLQQAAN